MLKLNEVFRYLVNDDTFLVKIINHDNYVPEIKKEESKKVLLQPSEINDQLPSFITFFVPENYFRYGIDHYNNDTTILSNITSKTKKISFLNSIRMIIRPELHEHNLGDQMKDFYVFESFVSHRIMRNSHHIDKVKKTKAVKTSNTKMKRNIEDGIITNEIIQAIVNIFEINLLIFDINDESVCFYWCAGIKYHYLNLFKRIMFLIRSGDEFEPIISKSEMSMETRQSIYIKILCNLSKIICHDKLVMFPPSIQYINSWPLTIDEFLVIRKLFQLNDLVN